MLTLRGGDVRVGTMIEIISARQGVLVLQVPGFSSHGRVPAEKAPDPASDSIPQPPSFHLPRRLTDACRLHQPYGRMLMEILPHTSVMPYDRKISQPSVATARARTAGDCGLPPQLSTRRLDVLASGSRGLLAIMMSMVEATLVAVIRSRSVGVVGVGPRA